MSFIVEIQVLYKDTLKEEPHASWFKDWKKNS